MGPHLHPNGVCPYSENVETPKPVEAVPIRTKEPTKAPTINPTLEPTPTLVPTQVQTVEPTPMATIQPTATQIVNAINTASTKDNDGSGSVGVAVILLTGVAGVYFYKKRKAAR
jgi:hypothetical protein